VHLQKIHRVRTVARNRPCSASAGDRDEREHPAEQRRSPVALDLRKPLVGDLLRYMGAANPFDDDSVNFFVLINDEEQHSLWPTFSDIPAGWRVVHGEAPRADCLEYIEQNWPDIRPKSLRERLKT
jgi:glycopeptidolipid biosynthesis protein